MIEEQKDSSPNAKILGINLLIFVAYTVIGVSSGGDGMMAAVTLAGVHFLACVIMAIANRNWIWFLSGLLILVIGFGTCVANV